MDSTIDLSQKKDSFHPSPDELKKIKQNSSENTLIPVYIRLDKKNLPPVFVYEALRQDYGFLLESMEGNEKNARYSIIGTGAAMHLVADPDIHITGINPAGNIQIENNENPAESLYKILRSIDYTDPDISGYSGGLAGYFSYDLALETGNILENRKNERDFPLAEFIMPNEYIIFDHSEENITILRFISGNSPEVLDSAYRIAHKKILKTKRKLSAVSSDENEISPAKKATNNADEYRSEVSRKNFEEIIETAGEYILNGDIFQVVLSKKSECDYEGDPFLIYKEMRRINPSPYMYFIDFCDKQIAGASPEMLVKVEDKTVTSVPIAGTRRRGRDNMEDAILENELLSDRKECAEHLMLVDLSRNDIGKISEYGSVMVRDFMSVEKFSHVQHIVSTVEGTLAEGNTSLDAFLSCFPAGTVSGAPKIRAMQIIEELENSSRGLYAGAVGYIGFNENIDMAIAIRTVVVKNKKASFQSGAGIVADSVPESEYFETESKAAGMKGAIETAGERA